MDQDAIISVAENSKKLAQKYVVENNFGRAFSHYLIALKLRPDWQSILKDEFSTALCKWGVILEEKSRMSDLFQCYEQAIEVFPNNEIVLNNLGAHLLRCRLLKEAAHYFQRSLAVKPNFIRAKRNLENVSNLAVERWHFKMLNDVHRNEAFRVAIIKKIRKGFETVLDIGTGTGLLSLFCLEGKASEIYACESSPIMFETAEKVLKRNNGSSIKLINKHSSQLLIPTDIPKRISLVVTETMDSGLLGENILFTLSHAWENLLLPPETNSKKACKFGFVIPSSAKIYVTGIECDSILNRTRVNAPENLFDFEKFCGIQNREKYDTQDLTLVDYKSLTNVAEVCDIDFNNPKFIREILDGRHNRELKLLCTEPGRLDSFAVWFDLLLDEEVTLNTGPHSRTNEAWEQAIFSLPESIFIREGQEISIRASFEDGQLCIKCEDDCEDGRWQPSKTVIKTLNNTQLVKALLQAKDKLVNAFDHSVRIMDWFSFPIFGLNFLVSRAENFKDEMTCFVSSEDDRKLVKDLAKKYGLKDRVTVEIENGIENCFLSKKKFDIIVLNFVETTGELKESCTSRLELIKALLNTNGIILPVEVTIMGQFIHSDWLLKASRVLDDNLTCGYHIGEFINLYKSQHFIDLDSGIDKIPLSNAMELLHVSSKETTIENEVSCFASNISVNAMIYWFKIQFMKEFDEIQTNHETSTFNQSAFLFHETKVYKKLKWIATCNDGLFHVELLIDDELV